MEVKKALEQMPRYATIPAELVDPICSELRAAGVTVFGVDCGHSPTIHVGLNAPTHKLFDICHVRKWLGIEP